MEKMAEFENKKKQLEAQLQQPQELKFIGIIVNDIVHSFNNIIGVIHGYADLALKARSSPERSQTYLKEIIKEADSAKNMAEQLRAFTGQNKPNFQSIATHPVIEQAIKIVKSSLSAQIDIQQDIDITCGTALVDADQIQQAVINLCRNACDAMCENGGILKIILKKVDIEASFAEEYKCLSEGRYVKLTVSDTGHGMDQNILEQIYDPFFTAKKVGKGAGLGLSVVHSIIMIHKGEIIVNSKPEEGTTFDIYLPLVNQD